MLLIDADSYRNPIYPFYNLCYSDSKQKAVDSLRESITRIVDVVPASAKDPYIAQALQLKSKFKWEEKQAATNP